MRLEHGPVEAEARRVPANRRPGPITATPGQIPTTIPTPDPSANSLAQLQFGPLFFLAPGAMRGLILPAVVSIFASQRI